MGFDITNDFEIFDGKESVELIQAGSGLLQIIEDALQFGINSRDAISSNGTYTQSDVKWNIPTTRAVVFEPAAGDFIKNGRGIVWVIGMVENITLLTRFVCWSKRPDLNSNTSQELKVFRPIYLKDEVGAAYVEWKLSKVVQGHIKEMASSIEIESGRKRLKITHQIFIVEAMELQAGYLIKDTAGDCWNVQRVTSKQSLGMAMVADVEKSRTPITN